MANDSTNNIVIDRDNSGFPPYLDFDNLRTSSIEYLSSLTGKVWTDYNVHDPGITILEMLIYAVLDLGYRTNLPAVDIFTSDPNDAASDENNFFTPAQILSCNPLTITDFRKLLIDIEGIRNAWLTVAEDIRSGTICDPPSIPPAGVPSTANPDSEVIIVPEYINGLYHISLELEEEVTDADKDLVIGEVKKALLTHRNLCEDFIDISLLCPLSIGINAAISLDANADVNEVYKNILVSLSAFFSPAPRFYTLQQLLDKGKPIEAIFAGRPYNYTTSHGFVDTDELEAITLQKEIHLSDVYNIILGINGIKTVRKLQLKLGDLNFSAAWQFVVPEGYTPQFSIDASSFSFSSNGAPVPFDDLKGTAGIKLFTPNVIQVPENLDLAIPRGVYHSDLADYYSIQNEFPLVYGIGKGGLPDTASPRRQAQALQLKGYLLFFDQLLADYLSQLSNIRSLFSFRSPDADNRHSYFTSQLENVPGLQDLLLNVADPNGASSAGNNGNVIAWPVSKAALKQLIDQGGFNSADVKNLQQEYTANTRDDYKNIAGMLQNDFNNDLYTISAAVQTSDEGWFYYVEGTNEDIVLTGNIFSAPAAAENDIKLLPVIAAIPASYNAWLNKGSFTFAIQLSFPTYSEYLQKITEGKTQYLTRRDAFLNHLLSRFAEQFTDFALLSYKILGKTELSAAVVRNKESFLTQYPVLSSQRGKAYDYRGSAGSENNGSVCGQENISGFEKRFKAYAGITNDAGNSLCNFEVAAYEDTYSVKLEVAGFHLLNTTTRYEGLVNAQAAQQKAFSSLSKADNYKVSPYSPDGKYQLRVQYDTIEWASYPALLGTQNDADHLSLNLQRMFNVARGRENIIISKVEFRLQLKTADDEIIRLSAGRFDTAEDAFATAVAALKTPNDPEKWEILLPDNHPSGKFSISSKKKPEKLMDLDAFKIDINNNIVGKPNKFNYEVLDKENAFKFRSVNEFDDEKQARSNSYRLLLLMVDPDNYQIRTEKRRTRLYITNNGKTIAECLNRIDGENKMAEFRDKICPIVRSHFYRVAAADYPSRWKFTFQLGFEVGMTLLFVSDDEFDTEEKASTAAAHFSTSLSSVTLGVVNARYVLSLPGSPAVNLTCTNADEGIVAEDNVTKLNQAKSFLALRQEISQRQQSQEPRPFEAGVEIDEISRSGAFVYRLVDRDRLLASHKIDPATPAVDQVDALYARAHTGYPVLDICLGGDNVVPDNLTGSPLYRYCIKCHSDCPPFKTDTILFKSVIGYASAADAETAFNQYYLDTLKKATDPAHYGPGQSIVFEEPGTNAGSGTRNTGGRTIQPLVFVPKDTQALIPGPETDLIKVLVEVAKGYPISREGSPATGYTYSFSLYNRDTDTLDWQSVKKYDTPAAAREDFYFFWMLLRFKGNYAIYPDECGRPTLFIREVLAESTSRFPDAKAAWGSGGIEKFICIAQTIGAFHAIISKDTGSPSFYVASDDLLHPDKYDTPAERDGAMAAAYQSFIDQHPGSTDIRADYDNYRPYFDCTCYSFGFAIHTAADIIASNPQDYLTPDMVCAAIQRSKKLINSEGLRLVEHILLRPRMEKDCACQYLQQRNFQNQTLCKDLSWKEEVFIKGDDKEKEIPFVPGSDPFSFIATVILPAWPERFRTKENRQLIETMLYREMPAHILLRILWLRPEDTCKFESLYKEWSRWLLQKEGCDAKDATCDLIALLFKTGFDGLTDCDGTPVDTTEPNYKWLENVDAVFGWQPLNG